MSQSAVRTIPVTEGNVAHVLSAPPATTLPEAPVRKSRAALSLVVSAPRKGRKPLAAAVATIIVFAMAVVLMMSISVAKGQYELVDLKSQQSDLIKANQAYEQDIAAKQAPQELVARAAALGMVPAGSTGQIDVRTKTVSGSPLPAKADTKGLVNLPPALIDKPKPKAEVEAPLSPAAKSAAQKKVAASAEKADTPVDQAKEPVKVPAPAPGPDLNGGTIPAPAQRDS